MTTLLEKLGSSITILAMGAPVAAFAIMGFKAYQEPTEKPETQIIRLSCKGETMILADGSTSPDTISITFDTKTQTVRVDDMLPATWIDPKEDVWTFNSFWTYPPGFNYSGTVNRITGIAEFHTPVGSSTSVFTGTCKPAQRMF